MTEHEEHSDEQQDDRARGDRVRTSTSRRTKATTFAAAPHETQAARSPGSSRSALARWPGLLQRYAVDAAPAAGQVLARDPDHVPVGKHLA